jgi:transcriptional regulator with XRE-family HTH domain
MTDKFNFSSYYGALAATVIARQTTWKSVSEQTGVSQSTLSRMAGGRQPDAASLTALSAWAGLNPVEFYSSSVAPAEPLALVGKLLREDQQLDTEGVQALEAIIHAAYERFRRSSGSESKDD